MFGVNIGDKPWPVVLIECYSAMFVDRRRCAWCGRLCRYFGEDQFHNCGRCQLWYERNRCCQIKNALGSEKGRAYNIRISLLDITFSPVAWPHILDLLCGSIHDVDMNVQERIWRRILCGQVPDWSSSDSDEDHWMQKRVPPGFSKFWKLWMLELKEDCRALVPQHHPIYLYHRPICVVIAFLGPFSDFGLADGSRWNRGWRYRES